jgi:hypothetical protein
MRQFDLSYKLKMIPNSSQTYERENTVATVNEQRQGDALKNGLFIVKTKTIPIDDQLKI